MSEKVNKASEIIKGRTASGEYKAVRRLGRNRGQLVEREVNNGI